MSEPLPPEAIADALALMALKHRTQRDKQGAPYIYHVVGVWRGVQGKSVEHEVAALLHDTVEDTDLTVAEIRGRFGDTVADAVEAITRREGEDYQDFVRRTAENPLARDVKLADLADNMARLEMLDDADARARLRAKYEGALAIIEAQD